MKRKIFSVGYKFPGKDVENIPFKSNRSLLDADIVIFQPSDPYFSFETFEGKPLLDDEKSFSFVENIAHWHLEINAAFDAGKTIFVFLSELNEYYVYTGKKEYSGTGRSRVTTNLVSLVNNYQSLPLPIKKVVNATGEEIKIANDLKYLSSYWNTFSKQSYYKVYIEGDFNNVIFTTKSGERILGAIINSKKGKILLLPPLSDDYKFFANEIMGIKIKEEKTTYGSIFGKQLLSHLIEIDKALKNIQDVTPIPEWAKQDRFLLEKEKQLSLEIVEITKGIEKLQETRKELLSRLHEEGELRLLLYEKGHVLEKAILLALKIMGFTAEGFQNADSEFDAIFESKEGRFLGEAEGKDRSAINVDKFSQLLRNLSEDYERDEIEEYAHGVLFGNAYRLQKPDERPDSFTEKCITSAKRHQIALVRTIDLFLVCKYIKDHEDASFAESCRNAIFNAKGQIVVFPDIENNK